MVQKQHLVFSFKHSAMKKALAQLFTLTLLLAHLCALPQLTQPVMDTASVMDSSTANTLNAFLEGVYLQTGTQLVVLTVPSLHGESIESYANTVFNTWGIGQKDIDNGALLVLAMQEHDIRIEVGYGLEETLTDALCSRIIRTIIVPAFQEEQYADGIDSAMRAIADLVSGNEFTPPERSTRTPSLADIIIPLCMFGFFCAIVIGDQLRIRRQKKMGTYVYRPTSYSNDNDSDSWGHSSGGSSGGFSGGGGSSGGGGASGHF